MDLNDYLINDDYYDLDKMINEINAIMRMLQAHLDYIHGSNKYCKSTYGDESLLDIFIPSFSDSKEFKEIELLNKELQEELAVVMNPIQQKYFEKIEKIQADCQHYKVKEKGKITCYKCNKSFE